jgi:hypothetical protein
MVRLTTVTALPTLISISAPTLKSPDFSFGCRQMFNYAFKFLLETILHVSYYTLWGIQCSNNGITPFAAQYFKHGNLSLKKLNLNKDYTHYMFKGRK